MSSIDPVWFIRKQPVGGAVHHLIKSMPHKSCWTFCNQGSVRFTNFFKDAVLQKHLLIWKSSAETNFSTICLKTNPSELLLNPLWAVNFIQWVSNISQYMLHSTSILTVYTWKWQSLGCNDFSTSYLGKFQQNLATKVFPKDGAVTNSLQPRLGNGMVTKAFSLARNVQIVTLHLSVVVPTRHPKWSHFVWEESGPKISSSPSSNEKYNS